MLKNFFFKNFFNWTLPVEIFWKKLSTYAVDLKKPGIINYYDNLDLYVMPRNFICVHSELHINKTKFRLRLLWQDHINKFFNGFFKKHLNYIKLWRWKKILKKSNLKGFTRKILENRIFRNFFLPFFTKKFEKTDEQQRTFFLNKYFLYWKLMPNSRKFSINYISKANLAEDFFNIYPTRLSIIFFKNFLNYIFSKKFSKFIFFKKYKFRKFFRKNIISLINMTLKRAPSNIFTQRTDLNFLAAYKFIHSFVSTIFENKLIWMNKAIFNKGFSWIICSSLKNHFQLNIRLNYAINWSTAKWFVWEFLNLQNYNKTEHFKTTKYIWEPLFVFGLQGFWKDFLKYQQKFLYNSLNFNFKRLLKGLLPKQKLFEYHYLLLNKLYNFANFWQINWKFFSLLKIFWPYYKPHISNKIKYNLLYDQNFDFNKEEDKKSLIIFFNELTLTKIINYPAYPTPWKYYEEIFFNKKNKPSLEFLMPNNFILSHTIMRFPFLINSSLNKWKFLLILEPTWQKKEFRQLLDLFKFSNKGHFSTTGIFKKYAQQLALFKNTFLKFCKNFLALLLQKSLLSTFPKPVFWHFLLYFKLVPNFLNPIDLYFLSTFLSYLKITQKFYLKNTNRIFFLKSILFWNLGLNNTIKKFFWPLKNFFTLQVEENVWSTKWLPLILYRLFGVKWTHSTGSLTLQVNNLNILAVQGYSIFTMEWTNPAYYKYDKKEKGLVNFNYDTWVTNLIKNQFVYPGFKFLFDRIFEWFYLLQNFAKNPLPLNNFLLNRLKTFLINIYPGSILNKLYFQFYLDYIINFENYSEGILTSRLRRFSHKTSYFMGPLILILAKLNSNLLILPKINKFFFLPKVYSLALLSYEGLMFPELVVSFQFNYKWLNLNRNLRVIETSAKNDSLHFLKILSSGYFSYNELEFHLFAGLISSTLYDVTWFVNIENFLVFFLNEDKITSNNLFPALILNKNVYNKYLNRWAFFGFTNNFWINLNIITSTIKFIVILNHYSWFFTARSNLITIDNDFDINICYSKFLKNLLYNKSIFLFNKISRQNLLREKYIKLDKFLLFKIAFNPRIIQNLHYTSNFLQIFLSSLFYTFTSSRDPRHCSYSNYVNNVNIKYNNFSFKIMHNYVEYKKLKLFLRFKSNFHFNEFDYKKIYQFMNFFSWIFILANFKYKFAKIKIHEKKFNLTKMLSLFKLIMVFFSNKKQFLFEFNWKRFFTNFFKKLLVIWILLLSTCLTKNSIKYFLYYFILYFYIWKKYLKENIFKFDKKFKNIFFSINIQHKNFFSINPRELLDYKTLIFWFPFLLYKASFVGLISKFKNLNKLAISKYKDKVINYFIFIFNSIIYNHLIINFENNIIGTKIFKFSHIFPLFFFKLNFFFKFFKFFFYYKNNNKFFSSSWNFFLQPSRQNLKKLILQNNVFNNSNIDFSHLFYLSFSLSNQELLKYKHLLWYKYSICIYFPKTSKIVFLNKFKLYKFLSLRRNNKQIFVNLKLFKKTILDVLNLKFLNKNFKKIFLFFWKNQLSHKNKFVKNKIKLINGNNNMLFNTKLIKNNFVWKFFGKNLWVKLKFFIFFTFVDQKSNFLLIQDKFFDFKVLQILWKISNTSKLYFKNAKFSLLNNKLKKILFNLLTKFYFLWLQGKRYLILPKLITFKIKYLTRKIFKLSNVKFKNKKWKFKISNKIFSLIFVIRLIFWLFLAVPLFFNNRNFYFKNHYLHVTKYLGLIIKKHFYKFKKSLGAKYLFLIVSTLRYYINFFKPKKIFYKLYYKNMHVPYSTDLFLFVNPYFFQIKTRINITFGSIFFKNKIKQEQVILHDLVLKPAIFLKKLQLYPINLKKINLIFIKTNWKFLTWLFFLTYHRKNILNKFFIIIYFYINFLKN
jgi:hypothetical protein